MPFNCIICKGSQLLQNPVLATPPEPLLPFSYEQHPNLLRIRKASITVAFVKPISSSRFQLSTKRYFLYPQKEMHSKFDLQSKGQSKCRVGYQYYNHYDQALGHIQINYILILLISEYNVFSLSKISWNQQDKS